MKTNKKAISLIVLVVTIIVLGILAATVIINLSNTNIIEEARKTAFKSDMSNYKEAYNLYLTSQYADNPYFDKSDLKIDSTTNNTDLYEELFGDKYSEQLKVVDGELIFETEDAVEQEVVTELGMAAPDKGYKESWFTTDCNLPAELPEEVEYYRVSAGDNDYASLIAKESLNGCFDEEEGIIYSVNLPDGVTELIIPESINGKKVNGISGLWSTDGTYTFMPNAITKLTLPTGIKLYSGAFSGENSTASNIELTTNGPIQLDLREGPTLITDSYVQISYLYSMYGGLSSSGISNYTFTDDFTGSLGFGGTNITSFQTGTYDYEIPRGLDVGDQLCLTNINDLTSGTIYMTQTQFNSLTESTGYWSVTEGLSENQYYVKDESGTAPGGAAIVIWE